MCGVVVVIGGLLGFDGNGMGLVFYRGLLCVCVCVCVFFFFPVVTDA